MPVTKGNHCAYDTHYHLVFPLKYRKALLSAEVVATMRETMKGIEERYDLQIEQFGDDKNHIHVLLSFSSQVQHWAGRTDLQEHHRRGGCFLNTPHSRETCGAESSWTDGHYAATVGTGGNWAVVEKYIRNQGHNPKDVQLTMW